MTIDFVVRRYHGHVHHSVQFDADPLRRPKEERALELARIPISLDVAARPLADLIGAYKSGTLACVRPNIEAMG